MSVPIWLSLMRIELAIPSSMPRFRRSTLVTKRSSPTSWTFLPSLSVRSFHVSQSSSAQPSSIETIGYCRRELLVDRDELGAADLLLVERVALRRPCRRTRSRRSRARGRCPCRACSRRPRSRATSVLDGLLVRAEARREAALVADGGGEALVLQVLLQRREDLGAGAERLRERRSRPAGTIMNSWISRPLSACAPPLMTFISGVGRTRALTPPR